MLKFVKICNYMNKKFDEFFYRLNNFSPEIKQKDRLELIANELNKKIKETNVLVFLCTHNSRRSQICEVWGSIFSLIYKKEILINSAGTIKTSVHKEIFNVLKKCGVSVNENEEIAFKNLLIKLKSKTLDQIDAKKFIAIMTCSDAEKSCPIDSRSVKNINMFFKDPKVYDNTKYMEEEYLKTNSNIAEELNYIFKRIN